MSRLDAEGLPLPELVDFRLTTDKKKAIFFMREGERYYRKHLDLTKEGAGLWTVNPYFGTVSFSRFGKSISVEAVSGAAFDRYIQQKYIVAGVTLEMACLLARVFWGKELDLTDWRTQEGVQSFPLAAAA